MLLQLSVLWIISIIIIFMVIIIIITYLCFIFLNPQEC